jgi:hypothetical protein
MASIPGAPSLADLRERFQEGLISQEQYRLEEKAIMRDMVGGARRGLHRRKLKCRGAWMEDRSRELSKALEPNEPQAVRAANAPHKFPRLPKLVFDLCEAVLARRCRPFAPRRTGTRQAPSTSRSTRRWTSKRCKRLPRMSARTATRTTEV